MSDDSEDSICAKNRRQTFLLEGKNSSQNVTPENGKSYKDKSLSMRYNICGIIQTKKDILLCAIIMQ